MQTPVEISDAVAKWDKLAEEAGLALSEKEMDKFWTALKKSRTVFKIISEFLSQPNLKLSKYDGLTEILKVAEAKWLDVTKLAEEKRDRIREKMSGKDPKHEVLKQYLGTGRRKGQYIRLTAGR